MSAFVYEQNKLMEFWVTFFPSEIKLLNSVFTHSWHNGTWNVLAELINMETTVIKITVIALALVLSYFIRKRSSKSEILSHSEDTQIIIT